MAMHMITADAVSTNGRDGAALALQVSTAEHEPLTCNAVSLEGGHRAALVIALCVGFDMLDERLQPGDEIILMTVADREALLSEETDCDKLVESRKIFGMALAQVYERGVTISMEKGDSREIPLLAEMTRTATMTLLAAAAHPVAA